MPSTSQLLVTLALFILLTVLTLTNLTIARLHRIFTRPAPKLANAEDSHLPYRTRRGHLMIILGSGGHTAEMLSALNNLGPEYLNTRFARRTWVVSSGDGFSAGRAREFEDALQRDKGGNEKGGAEEATLVKWDITTVRRARRVHQSLFTTPVSASGCLWDCLNVLRGRHVPQGTKNAGAGAGAGAGVAGSTSSDTDRERDAYTHNYPDLILTNGPGTGVIMVLASLILLFCGAAPVRLRLPTSTSARSRTSQTTNTDTDTNTTREVGAMRTIYIESWARVKTLSLSGRILRFMASRVLVQWWGSGLGDVDLTKMNVDGIQGERIAEEETKKEREKERGTIWPRKMEYIGAIVT